MPNKSDNNNNKIRKVVVVTGSGKNIGKAIALEFGKARYCVMINDFEQEEKIKRTAQEISQTIGDDNYNRVAYVVGDISEEEISISLIEQTIKRFGRIDVLINNAAIAEKKAAVKKSSNATIPITTTAANPSYKQLSPYFTLEEYELADLSLKASYLCIREAAKRMITSNDMKDEYTTKGGGIYSIINISSSYDSIPKPDADAYTSSMSGVDPFTSSRAEVKTLTKTVAFQLAEKGIRVNAIAPGLIATDSNKQLLENEGKRKEKEKKVPFHRIGQPEEIAKIALFLASEDASYITGSIIYAYGGLSLPHSNYFLESEIQQD